MTEISLGLGRSPAWRRLAEAAPYVAGALICLPLPLIVLINIDRGVDFSDVGYYYVSIRHLAEIDMQTTQFGVAWRLLPLPDDIVWNRVAVLLLMSASAAFLCRTAWRLAWPDAPTGRLELLCIGALGAGAAAIYYFSWIPDPSYNALGYILDMTLVALAFRSARVIGETGRLPRIEAALIGALGLALAITRPPTALALAALLPLVILAMGRPSLKATLKFVLFSLLGALLFVLVVSVAVEPFPHVVERMFGGLERRVLLDRDGDLSTSYDYFREDIGRALEGRRLLLGLIAIGVWTLALREQLKLPRWAPWAGSTLAAVGMVLLLRDFLTTSDGLHPNEITPVSDFVFLIVAVTLLCMSASVVTTVVTRGRSAEGRAALVGAVLIVAQAVLVVGSSNNWLSHSLQFSAFTFIAFWVFAADRGRLRLAPWPIAAVAAFLAVEIATLNHMAAHPYRIEGTLAAQTERVTLRDGRSSIRTDPATRDLLVTLAEAADALAPDEDERPILIDMTGRLPLVTYHLHARAPGTPWIISGYPGSQALFDRVVARIDDANLRAAWILRTSGAYPSFAADALTGRGLDLARDYDVVARGYSTYLDDDVLLLAPKAAGP